MTSCPTREELAGLLDDASAARADLESHLGDCDTCQRVIESLAVDPTEWEAWDQRMRADDVRIRQLQRKVKQAEAAKDAAAARESQKALLRLELTSYKARVEAYPTDNKLKYRYGKLLMMGGAFFGWPGLIWMLGAGAAQGLLIRVPIQLSGRRLANT